MAHIVSALSSDEERISLFTYGTLVHPAILSRVLSGTLQQAPTPSASSSSSLADAQLTVIPAILPHHEIRRVKGQEYPALIKTASPTTTAEDNVCVRGVVIHGLTRAQLQRLDEFEGDEYARVAASVMVSRQDQAQSNAERLKWSDETISGVLDAQLPEEKCEAMLKGGEEAQEVQVQTYIWAAAELELEEAGGVRGPWVFSEFASSGASSRWTTGEWTDAGGPDGIQADVDRQATSTPIPTAPRPGRSGFDEIQRGLSYDNGSLEPASFSTLSIGDDPWADPPASSTAGAAPGSSDNPWDSGDTPAGPTSTAQPLQDGGVDGSATSPTAAPARSASFTPRELDGQEAPGYERFGKPCRRLWYHGDVKASGARPYLNINAGAFGSCPKPVLEAAHGWSIKAEENPDLFRRRTYPTALRSIIQRLSTERLPHCPPETLAILRNSTTGTNAVLRGFPFQAGDHILCFSTVYGALEKTIDYLVEHGVPVTKVKLEVTYPISHDDLVKAFTTRLRSLQAEGKRVRMATFDAVSSHPGVVVPWERLCVVCKQEGVLSLVDAAHSFGQVDVSALGSAEAPADFWVSNIHKWGYAPRGCAVLYVPREHRWMVPSTVPTSWGWKPKAERSKAEAWSDAEWFYAWSDAGTDQLSNFLSIDAALDFVRDRLGGEERVRRYNHALARRGGAKVAEILGTEVMDVNEGELIASMVNVRLPLVSRAIGSDAKVWLGEKGGENFFFETLQDDFATNIPVLVHGNAICARLGAQVWLDVDDFEYAGRALKEVCRRVNEGEMAAATKAS